MKKKLFRSFKDILINFVIILIILLGIGNVIHSLPIHINMFNSRYCFFSPQIISLHKSMALIIGFALIFVSYGLLKRVKTAWIITVCVVPLSLYLHLLAFNGHLNFVSVIELLIILVLVFNHKDFKRVTNPITLKRGIVLAFVSILLVVINTACGLFLMKTHVKNIHDFLDAVGDSFQLLFFMDVSYIEPKSKVAIIFGKSEIIAYWASIILALCFILKPLIYQPIITKIDRIKVRELLNLYAKNPISYVAVEEDKQYFFGVEVQGVVAYVIAGTVAVCAGDPICCGEDTIILLSEFIRFCKQNGHDICFCQVMPETLKYFNDLGFGVTKYGEEAMFNLNTYELSGGKCLKIRNAINHAGRLGIDVVEYKPLQQKDKHIEEQIMEVSQEWLDMKKSGELSFMLGTVSLDNPMDRRYFVAFDPDNQILGFVVFVPFNGGKGYMADVTRRRHDAPIGVMEKIMISAFNQMKSEGVEWGCLGLAPLYNVDNAESEQKTFINSILNFVYEHMNHLYGFKSLYHYKKKYAPTDWEPRYLAYYPNAFTPQIAYSLVKAQNPKGIKEYLLIQLKNMFKNKE